LSPDARRTVVLALAGLLAVAGGLALGGRTATPRADFAFCNQFEVSSLDPAIATGVPEARVLGALYEGLTRPDPRTTDPLPGVATAWECSSDGLTWRFDLRDDARWTNGDAVTAEDFAYSFRRLLHPDTAARYAYLLWCVEGAEAFTKTPPGEEPDDAGLGIRAEGPRRLLLRLCRPCPYLPRLTAYHPLFPVHRPTVETHGSRWIKPANIVTNGPFRLVERRVRDRIRLARFEGYWGADEVSLRTIDAYAADGVTTQLNMYLTGVVDWMIKPPPTLVDVVLERPDVVTGPQLGTTLIRFNTTRPPFDDRRVRTALALALDREALARDVMRGGRRPARSFVPDAIPGYAPAPLPPHDPERARALLAEAGFPGGDGVRPFELLYPHTETARDFCEAVASQWRRTLGVRAHLVNQAWKVYLDSAASLLYDVSWGSWIGDYLDPSTFLEVFHSDSLNNRTGWGSPIFDGLLREAAVEPDEACRMDLFRRAETLLLEELPLAPIYRRVNLHLVAPRVEGFHDNPLDLHPLRDLRVAGGRP